MIGCIRCCCGANMYLRKDVRSSAGIVMLYLCSKCHLAWSPIRTWLPEVQAFKFKLPDGKIVDDLESSYTQVYYERRKGFLTVLFE